MSAYYVESESKKLRPGAIGPGPWTLSVRGSHVFLIYRDILLFSLERPQKEWSFSACKSDHTTTALMITYYFPNLAEAQGIAFLR